VGSTYSGEATTVGASSAINGNIYSGAAITLGAGSTVSGSEHLRAAPQYSNATYLYTSAMSSMNTAITEINNRTATSISGTLDGVTLTPGVYSSVNRLGLTGVLTLDAQGDSNAIFIIRSNSYLVTAASSDVILANQAQAKNVFWVPQDYFTAGADSIFKGNVLAATYISIGARTAIEGRLFSRLSYVVFGSGNADSVFGITGIGTTEIAATASSLTPTFGTPTPTADGFTVQISNYSALFNWSGTATARGTVVISGTGLVTVRGVAAGTASTATVTTTRTGYTGGTASISDTSITGSALTPTFGTPIPTADGFTVQISNYSALHTWSGTATGGGTVVISSTGLVTVRGVATSTASTATITTTRTGYTGGTASISDTLTTGSAHTPTFGTSTPTADGFTVQISNYSALHTWSGTATGGGTVVISGTGLVTVGGVAPGTASTATITTTRTGYTGGTSSVAVAPKTIEFTDTTLVDGTRGQAYNDYVAARTLLNGSANSQTVTYSISPSLADLGLSMDSVGVITGTVLPSATVGTHSFTVSALSLGYFTQTYVYPLVIKDAAASKYVTIKLSVNFSSGSSKLSIVQKAKILLFVIKVKPMIVDGIVIGYVQKTKKSSNDKTLSAARAQVIAKFLAANGVKVPLLTQGSGVLNGSNAARVSTISLRYYKL